MHLNKEDLAELKNKIDIILLESKIDNKLEYLANILILSKLLDALEIKPILEPAKKIIKYK